jgi:hypothetical protein
VVSATDPPAVNSVFLTRAATFSLKYLLNYHHEADWTPFQTHYFKENVVAPGIEPGTSGSVARNSDHQTTEAVDAFYYYNYMEETALHRGTACVYIATKFPGDYFQGLTPSIRD